MKKLKAQSSKLKTITQNLKFYVLSFGFTLCALSFTLCNAFAKQIPSLSAIQIISSTELIERAKEYDGKIITFKGEAIGNIMKRGNFAWVNVNDGQNAIGIWAPVELVSEIKYLGGYKFVGDTVEIKGKFNRACIEHGGDLDIHADNLEIIKSGSAVEEKLDIDKYKAALGFLGVVLCLGILRTLRKRRRKK